MALSSGTRLGPYEVIVQIGVGGMGEVYKATDTNLKRAVAIKVLPASVAGDAERLARFQREAEVLAALNHPNIAAIYGLERSGAITALVMELVEGPTLADRIAQGAIPIDDALPIAKQIAEALEAAHEQGIIHRDLKPANIKVRPDGTVKVLDFGLAKAMEPVGAMAASNSMSPTITTPAMTQAGMIVGTAAYMSPEQARGKTVDKRADIWAFGVVLFEMLTGQRAFPGEDLTDTLAAVVKLDPNWDAVGAGVPARVRQVMRVCLQKDPRQRAQAIGDVRLAFEGAFETAMPQTTALSAATPAARAWPAWATAGLFGIAAAALAFVHFREVQPDARSVRFQVAPPEKASIQNFRLSPDGRFLAFRSDDRRLWVRALDSLQANPLPGTDGITDLFWSPDSQFIGFFAQGKLKKIAVSGGPPQVLCDAQDPRGGAWNSDGIILFAPTSGSGLLSVPASGGTPVQVTKPEDSSSTESLRYPQFLPDGRHFLYTVVAGTSGHAGIHAGSLDGKPSVHLLPDVSSAIYATASSSGQWVPGRSGYLLFRRGETLLAQPFDPAGLRIAGESFPIAERVGEGAVAGLGTFSVSRNGTLAYGVGASAAVQLVWADRTGKPMGSFGPPGAYNRFRLAPDEKRIVFDLANQDVWVLDAARGATSRLTSDPAFDNVPAWSADGLRVLFSSNRAGGYDVYTKPASGTGKEELLIKMGTGSGAAVDWSKDGRFILYQMPVSKTGQDLWIAPQFAEGADGDRKPFPYLQSQFDEQDGRFSPDGKWIAYVSNESGRDEIYLQSFPASDAKFRISSGGGSEPQWRSDGTELFYLAADGNLMAVPVKLGRSTSESLQAGVPKALMPVPSINNGIAFQRTYAVSNDGQQFLIPGASPTGSAPPLTVVLNWQAGLKR